MSINYSDIYIYENNFSLKVFGMEIQYKLDNNAVMCLLHFVKKIYCSNFDRITLWLTSFSRN